MLVTYVNDTIIITERMWYTNYSIQEEIHNLTLYRKIITLIPMMKLNSQNFIFTDRQ